MDYISNHTCSLQYKNLFLKPMPLFLVKECLRSFRFSLITYPHKPLTNNPRFVVSKPYLKAMISMDYGGFGLYPLV